MSIDIEGTEKVEMPPEPAAHQEHFALEGTRADGTATVLRCHHHLEGDDKTKPIGMSEVTINLGDISLWLCTTCNVRLREAVMTDIMVTGTQLMLRHDPEFVKELTERMRSEREAKDGKPENE